MFTELTVQAIQGKIIHLPNRPPFMLAKDLADIYETVPKQITQAVRRNPQRFPADFCFELSPDEISGLQNEARLSRQATESKQLGFTRFGANMLSAVLKSEAAAARSVQIMRAFSELEEAGAKAAPDPALLAELERLRRESDRANKLVDFCRSEMDRQDEVIGLLRFKADTLEARPPTRRPFAEAEKAEARRRALAGERPAAIAKALGRPVASVETLLRGLRRPGGAA